VLYSVRSLGTHVRCKPHMAVKVPDQIPLQIAGAIPVVYLTAYHAIVDVGQIQPGQTILIHSGAGGLGQACIQIAKLFNTKIFTTVGNDAKRQLLIGTYGIPDNHIFSSRTPTFVQGIKRMTADRGVDIIINSLANEALKCTWECIAPFGRFIEVGKRDIYSLGTLPMFPFSKNVSFIGVDLMLLSEDKPHKTAELLEQIIKCIMRT
jgi:NADPH:quinone reductase-like Zn-dependent oxidoreductase